MQRYVQAFKFLKKEKFLKNSCWSVNAFIICDISSEEVLFQRLCFQYNFNFSKTVAFSMVYQLLCTVTHVHIEHKIAVRFFFIIFFLFVYSNVLFVGFFPMP